MRRNPYRSKFRTQGKTHSRAKESEERARSRGRSGSGSAGSVARRSEVPHQVVCLRRETKHREKGQAGARSHQQRIDPSGRSITASSKNAARLSQSRSIFFSLLTVCLSTFASERLPPHDCLCTIGFSLALQRLARRTQGKSSALNPKIERTRPYPKIHLREKLL